MSLSSFQALVRELGLRLGAPAMQADDSGYLALTIDDLEIHLQYEPEDDVILIFTRLSEVDVDRAAEIYGMLLQANLFWQGTAGATFSVDADTGRVFLADRRHREGIAAEALDGWLEAFVNVASHWQQRLAGANAGGPLDVNDENEEPAAAPFTPLDGIRA